MEEKLDPWGATYIKDYKKIMIEFGIENFSDIFPFLPNLSLSMKRGVVFGHKDFARIAKAIREKTRFAMLTGLMPSGVFHFGHKIVADQIIYYQQLGAECFITAADLEAYLTRNISLEKSREIAIQEYLLNYIALGLQPKKTHFYFQTRWKREYMNLSKFISKKTTFNEMKAIYGEISPAKLTSALTQAADILHPQLEEFGGPCPTVVPVGADQLPHINFTRDIAIRMKSEFNFIVPSATFNILLPGLQGGKMSSSIPESYIALTDTPEIVEKKIKKYAFSGGKDSLDEHRKKGANLEIDIPYQYLRICFEPDDKKLLEIASQYQSGKMSTSEIKQIVIEKINHFLHQHQKKRNQAKKDIDKFLKEDDGK